MVKREVQQDASRICTVAKGAPYKTLTIGFISTCDALFPIVYKTKRCRK